METVNNVISPLVCINFMSVVIFYAKGFMDFATKGFGESMDIIVFGIVNTVTWMNVANFHSMVSHEKLH